MRKFFLIIFLYNMCAFAQEPVVQFLQNKADVSGYWVATDGMDNTYVTGGLYGASVTFGGTTLVNPFPPNKMMFIVKYDPTGTVLWANQSTSGFATGISVAADAMGNSYVTGYFDGANIAFGGTTLTNVGTASSDVFTVKYDPMGNVLWAASAGSADTDVGQDIAADNSGNCYVTGQYKGTSITFGGTTLINPSPASDAIFIVKYDATGNVVWAKSGGSGYGTGVGVDINDNLYTTGIYFGASISFDTVTASGGGGGDMYVVKHNTNGNALWVRSTNGSAFEGGFSLTADEDGNSYIAGAFGSTDLVIGTDTLSTSGNNDAFWAKYDANGNALWAKSGGGSGYDVGTDIAPDPAGNYFVVGNFTSDSMTFENTTIVNDTTNGSQDVFIVKYDANENIEWVTNAGGLGGEYAFGMAADRIGNIYTTGYFESNNFTLGTSTVNMIPGTYSSNMFLAKIGNNCLAYYVAQYDTTLNNFTIYVDSVSLAAAVGYHWDFGDGTSSTLAAPSHVYAADTLYNLCMKIYTAAGDSCEYCHTIGIDSMGNITRTTGFTLNVHQIASSVQSVVDEVEITVAPNPFTSATSVNFSEEQKGSSLRILDVMGKEIKAMTFSGKQLTIERDEMKPGIYFLQIVDQNKKAVNKKLVVQ